MAECGLLNLASCIPEKLFQYFTNIVNAPIKPLLNLVQGLLSEPININLFGSVWAIIVYMISMFYSFLFIYSGFNFMISGYDAHKRENAKSWLRNTIIMIILIQASFFIYELAIELSSSLTTATLTLVDKNFFLLTFDNIVNIALQFIFIVLYLVTLLLTSLVLITRYVVVAIGVVLFPLAIFFYFLPPLREYGSLIMNFLGVNIFITFIDAVILIGFSKLLNVGIFGDMKILVVIAGLLFIDILMLFMMFFSILKAAFSALSSYTRIAGVIAKL